MLLAVQRPLPSSGDSMTAVPVPALWLIVGWVTLSVPADAFRVCVQAPDAKCPKGVLSWIPDALMVPDNGANRDRMASSLPTEQPSVMPHPAKVSSGTAINPLFLVAVKA